MIKNFSLKAKILILTSLINLVISAAALFSLNRLADSYKSKVSAAFDLKVDYAKNSIADLFFDRYHDVQAFAANRALHYTEGGNLEDAQKAFDKYIDLYKIYELIVFVSPEGRYLASNSKSSSGKKVDISVLKNYDFRAEVWFQKALKGEFTHDPAKGIEGTFVDLFAEGNLCKIALGQEGIVSTFTTQVLDSSGKLIGILTARAHSGWYSDGVSAVISSLQANEFKRVRVGLIDPNGVLFSNILVQDGELRVESPQTLAQGKSIISYFPQDLAGGFRHIVNKPTELINQQGVKQKVIISKMKHSKWPDSLEWYVGLWGNSEDVFAAVISTRSQSYFVNAALAIVFLIVSWLFGTFISKSIQSRLTDLKKNSGKLLDQSSSLSASSSELAATATEQAASVQETVAAVEEINSMVAKNADAAEHSLDEARRTLTIAEKGKEVVEQMLAAIRSIGEQSQVFSQEQEKSSARLSEINGLIQEIGSKTKVINEIVFQTKLLSFNASVEAARAGEYGKGFAVVAEEVGNLAQMSGQAAKEISDLLEQSISRVEGIIRETTQAAQDQVEQTTSRVQQGEDVANQTALTLNEILEHTRSLQNTVQEIATASKEQAAGIQEISKAVGEIEVGVQQTSTVSSQTSGSSEELKSQSEELASLVNSITELVLGHSSDGEVKAQSHGATPPQHRSRANPSSGDKVVAFHPHSQSQPVHAPSLPPVRQASGSGLVSPKSSHPGFRE